MWRGMPPSFYVFHGTQELLLDEELQKLRARMPEETGDLNITELDGASVRVAEILNLASTSPFLAGQRLVIVRGLLSWLGRRGAGAAGKREADALYEGLTGLPSSARLVLVEHRDLEPPGRGRPRRNRFVQLARDDSGGYTRAFRLPQDIGGWILRRARERHDAEIGRAAAMALAEVTRGDLRRVDNELLKLASYVDGERAIDEEDVALLTPWVAEARTFDLTDALAGRSAARAQELLQQMLAEDSSSDGLILFATVVTHFRRLLLTREHLLLQGSAQGLAQSLGLRPGRYLNKLQQQARLFALADLEAIHRELQKNDLAMKTGNLRPGLALEMLVAALA